MPRTLQTVRWILGSARFMDDCRRRYGDVFTLDLLARAAQGPGAAAGEARWVFLADPEHVKQVFTADPSIVRAGVTNRFLEPLVGSHSILVRDEPEHMTERKLMLPSFHGERIKGYAELMTQAAEAEIARWPVGEPFALWPRMQAVTLEVIVRAVFGISEPGRLRRMQDVLRTLLNGMTSPRWLAVQAVRAALAGPQRVEPSGVQGSRTVSHLLGPVDGAVMEEIRRRRSAPALDEYDDILSLLMQARYEDGSGLSDEALRDELMTLLIAGHESTATALAWAFERLLRHPEKLSRLRDEAAVGEDSYADAVVKETLRLRPVLPFVLRKLGEPMEIGGYPLPEGTWVAPCGYLVHRREDVYPDPERFLPERFVAQPAGTYTWLPFGGGVRRCLGASFAQLEMKQVLKAVATRVELRPARPSSERVRQRFITLAPGRGAEVVMSARRPPAPPHAQAAAAGVAGA